MQASFERADDDWWNLLVKVFEAVPPIRDPVSTQMGKSEKGQEHQSLKTTVCVDIASPPVKQNCNIEKLDVGGPVLTLFFKQILCCRREFWNMSEIWHFRIVLLSLLVT